MTNTHRLSWRLDGESALSKGKPAHSDHPSLEGAMLAKRLKKLEQPDAVCSVKPIVSAPRATKVAKAVADQGERRVTR